MLFLLAFINLLAGLFAFVFYAFKASSLFPNNVQEIFILSAGIATLSAAGTTLRRPSCLFYGMATSCLVFLNRTTFSKELSPFAFLKKFLQQIPEKPVAFICLIFCVLLAIFLDWKRSGRTQTSSSKKTPLPANPKTKSKTGSDNTNAQKLQEKKIISCRHCHKKMRVRIGTKKVKCPQCRKVFIL
jgi:hypothetical protein